MNTKIKARLEQLTADIEIINGALDLAHQLIARYIEARNFSRANLTSDTIDSLIEERAALMEERYQLMMLNA